MKKLLMLMLVLGCWSGIVFGGNEKTLSDLECKKKVKAAIIDAFLALYFNDGSSEFPLAQCIINSSGKFPSDFTTDSARALGRGAFGSGEAKDDQLDVQIFSDRVQVIAYRKDFTEVQREYDRAHEPESMKYWRNHGLAILYP